MEAVLTDLTCDPPLPNACCESLAIAVDARGLNILVCLASAERWRSTAGHLRDHADLPHLAPAVSATLLREATMADAMAAWWTAGAVEH